MREKRAFEASLPSIDDAERLPERQAMIEAWEAAEWAEREDEIKGVQEERLALLENALQVSLKKHQQKLPHAAVCHGSGLASMSVTPLLLQLA